MSMRKKCSRWHLIYLTLLLAYGTRSEKEGTTSFNWLDSADASGRLHFVGNTVLVPKTVLKFGTVLTFNPVLTLC